MGKTASGTTKRSKAAPKAQADLISLSCLRTYGPVRGSQRAEELKRSFGLAHSGGTLAIAPGAGVRIGPGRIILLTGPSGSGKSSALNAMAARHAGFSDNCADRRRVISVSEIEFSPDCAIIDEIAPRAELGQAATLLTACGLGEPGLWIKPFGALSEGEKFRARLARAISLQHRSEPDRRFGIPLIVCDEFCSGLHRRAAKAIAHNLRKLTSRAGICIAVASASDDLTADLDPDAVVQLTSRGEAVVVERTPLRPGIPTIRRHLTIEPGTKRDYEEFASMHYRGSEELGFVDRVFVLRDGQAGDTVGIVVYAHAALELSLRNKATKGWFTRSPSRVNRHLRVLRRLVIHPDVRGCGLGRYLVRKTLPLVGTRFVECLAAMGEFNPVFERAGMIRIGQYDAPTGPRTAVEALKLMDIDPLSPDLAVHVARRPGVRAVIANAVAEWYAATTADGERRVERQSPENLARSFRGLIGVRPVYYLWRRGLSRSQTIRRGSLRDRRPRRIS